MAGSKLWQPAETAPKDGTRIAAWTGGRVTYVQWGEIDGEEGFVDEVYGKRFFVRPLQWMPLDVWKSNSILS